MVDISQAANSESRNRARALAVVLASGGMDSCVTTAIASLDYRLAMLHVGYGQRTEQRELRAFTALADFYRAERRLVCRLDHLRQIGGSSLTDAAIAVERANLERKDIPSSYVPFRNAHFISIATSWGEVLGAKRIFIGAVAEDSSGYPDCRPEYYEVFNRVIAAGTRPETELMIVTPVIQMRKSEIVRRGVELGAPFELTWSCYQSEEVACGVCDSCALRLRAFEEAGVRDPIPYAQRPSYARRRVPQS
ncbi:MAG: 7-cyano-7-deazaguanine synthase QueC [Acidobacteria bacterium]|nr:7-cyano-7-deazaguanine synthase QueC [Acidobacteriota bacterium]